jgi:hypothetical protein
MNQKIVYKKNDFVKLLSDKLDIPILFTKNYITYLISHNLMPNSFPLGADYNFENGFSDRQLKTAIEKADFLLIRSNTGVRIKK